MLVKKDNDIINFIKKVDEDVRPNISNNNENKASNEKIWVFFDEINTCNSMGLLSEIFYKHSYYGHKLNDNITFIAACNPYRLKNNKEQNIDGNDFCLTLKDKNFSYKPKQNLVYLVNPLPHSLLTSVFDFGDLSNEDEKKYIRNIVKETLNKYEVINNFENLFVDEIVICQNFLKGLYDISSVSLRELRRFNILFEFFVGYLKNRNDIHIKNSFVILNKNSKKYDEFGNENDNLIEKFVKGLGNIFIKVCNKFNEKDKLSDNLNKFSEEIDNSLVEYKDKFITKIMKRTEEILEGINSNIMNITGNFDSIIKKREQYEKIKEEFYEAIYGKK